MVPLSPDNRGSPFWEEDPHTIRCGCGYANYTIMTDGHIGPCPVMAGMSDYYVGHIRTAHPLGLQEIGIRGSCADCRIFGFCGGRCLYADAIWPWSPAQKELVCSAVYALHEGLTGVYPNPKECHVRQHTSG